MGVTQRLGTIPLAIQTDSSNNVGIGGAANASYKLAVTGAGLFTSGLTATANTSGAFAGLTLANSGTGSAQVFLNNSAQSWIVNLRTDNHFSIFNNTASTTPFFINTNGNVGIGSTNPVGTLEIFKSSTPYLRINDGTRYVNIGVDGTSVFYNTNSSHRFYVQDGTNNALTIASTGNVGIGTSVPQYSLALPQDSKIGWNDAGSTKRGSITVNSSADAMVFTTGTSDTERMRITSGGTVISYDNFSSYSGFRNYTGGVARGGMYTYASISGGGTDYSNTIFSETGTGIYFCTNGSVTRNMTITSGGSVCINRTSGSGELNVQGTIYLYLTSAGAGNSTLKYNTSTGAVTYDTSARIFKKDITDLEYGLDSVLKMSSKKYKWKSNDANDLGFIADEMYQVVPEVVYLADNTINKTELEDGEPMGINYDRLVPVLVKAIQELSAKVTALENK